MHISLHYSPYLKCIKETESFNNERKIFSCAKENFQFHYGTVTYTQYSIHAQSEGWIQRKMLALPVAAGALAETICLLAIGILATVFCGWKVSKPCFFHATRSLQIFGGALLLIFHDTWGRFNVHESIFQSTCYNLHLDSVSFLKFALQNNQQETIPLLTVKDMENCDSNQFNIVKEHLNPVDQEIDVAEYPDAGNIPLTNLGLFQADYIAEHIAEFPAVVCQLFTEEQIQQIELSKLSAPQINVLFSRLSTFNNFSVDDIAAALIKGYLDNIPLNFLTQEHLARATLDNLSAVTLKKIFECEEHLDKFKDFYKYSVQDALYQGRTLQKAGVLDLISDDQLKDLRISQLDAETILLIFASTTLRSPKTFEDCQRRFALINPFERRKAWNMGLLKDIPLIFWNPTELDTLSDNSSKTSSENLSESSDEVFSDEEP